MQVQAMNNIDGMKKRVDKLAEINGGNIVLIFTDQPEQEKEHIAAERASGNIPLVFPEEDRYL
jgi:hypothetical protein